MRTRSRISSRQRGAIAMMTAFFLMLGILCLVLVVDTGRLYYEQRRLQRIADTTALDTATEGGLCNVSNGPSLLSLASTSATRNGFTGNLASAPNEVQGGYLQTVDGIRVFTDDTNRQEAVHVVLGRSVPASLVAGGIFGGTVNLRAQATAQRVPIATFSAGSKLLSINTQQSALLNPLLNGLLGTHLALDAVGYQGVANADVNVLELMQAAGLLGSKITVGSVNEALNTNITAANFINSAINVLDEKQVAGVALLRSQLVGIKNANIKLADILAVDSTPGIVQEALKANVNVLELILATAMAANKNNFVDLNLGVAGISAKLKVIEPPQVAVGLPGMENGEWRTRARTAQIKLVVGADKNVLGLLAADLGLTVNVAQGDAWFEQARCRTLATGETDIDLQGQTGLASLGLTNSAGTGPATVQVSVILPLVKAELGLNSTIGISNVRDIDYQIENKREELPMLQTMSSSNGIATKLDDVTVNVTYPVVVNLGLIVNPLKNLVVGSLVNNVVNPIVTPLLTLLGVQPGVMDVMLIDVREAPAILAG